MSRMVETHLGQCFYISWLTEVIILKPRAGGRKKKNLNCFFFSILVNLSINNSGSEEIKKKLVNFVIH